eukprot:UN25330
MDLDSLSYLQNHPLYHSFALHNKAQLENSIVKRTTFAKSFDLPLEEIQVYYGEYIAMYFSFVGFYGRFLIPPAIIGSLLFLYQMMTDDLNNGFGAVFALGMIFWAISFPKLWQKQQLINAAHWGQTEQMNKERVRPEFEGQWVPSTIDGRQVPHSDPTETRNRAVRTRTVIA